MFLKNTTDSELIEKTHTVIRLERESTAVVLRHFEEIERRKLYLEKGYSSLYSMAVKEFGYSDGEAFRRVSSMRCLRSLESDQREDIEEKLESGKLNLTHLTQVQSVIRTARPEAKAELLLSLEGLSTRESERKIATQVGSPVPKREVVRPISENETHISLVVDQETMDLLERFQALTSHRNPKGSKAVALKLALQTALQKIDPARKFKTPSAPKVESDSRHIPNPVKREVWMRDQGRCTFTDPKTGRRCDSKHLLQLDHRRPFAHYGGHEAENLRLLCHAHHQNETERIFGTLHSKYAESGFRNRRVHRSG